MPASGPDACGAGVRGAFIADELRLLLREERRVADRGNPRCRSSRSTRRARRRVSGRGSASRRANFLCQRATSGAPSAMRSAVARASAATCASGTTRVTRPFSFASCCVEDAAFEQDLERDRGSDEPHERRHLRVRHHEPEILDRRAEPARLAADAQVAQRRDLESAADTDAVDLRDQRMAAGGERRRRCVHHVAVLDRLRLVRALGGELADVVAGRERLLAGAAHDDAAQVVVGGKRADRLAQMLPHRAWSAR